MDLKMRRGGEETPYERLFVLSPHLCCVAGFDGFFKELNPAWEKALGYTREELFAKPWLEFVHPEDRPAAAALRGRLDGGKTPASGFETRFLCKDGSCRRLLWHFARLPEDGLFCGAAADITEQRRAGELLARSEARLKETQSLALLGSWSWDPAADTALWSEELYAILRRDPSLPPLSFAELQTLFTPESRALILEHGGRTLATGEPYRLELEQLRCDGEPIWVLACGKAELDASGRVVRMHGTTQDITARKIAEREKAALEDRLLQAQKIELVGRLAGGLAHDFNNLLSNISGHAEYLKAALPAGDPRREDVEAIMEAGNSGAALTRQLLAFSRPQAPAPRPLDLNAVLDGMRGTLRRLLGDGFEAVFTPGPGLAPVKADPSQLEQVVMNLALNARDSMPGGGRIFFETWNVLLEKELLEGPRAVPAGRYVRLAVTDKGCGVDAAVLPRIFEPFFTTKASGKGTGLGLAIVQWIIGQSNGHISVRSAPGEGTSFRIYLPQAE
ncbi:MAG: PAS domain-containing protein [Elusimicrobia bacterium]|nr:PAS domain-containing protein [Elusimicrobiota bacterium]